MGRAPESVARKNACNIHVKKSVFPTTGKTAFFFFNNSKLITFGKHNQELYQYTTFAETQEMTFLTAELKTDSLPNEESANIKVNKY